MLSTLCHKSSFWSFILWIVCLPVALIVFITQSRLLTTLRRKLFEKIMVKGENAGNQDFLLFPLSFLSFQKPISNFLFRFILSSTNAFYLD